MNIIALAAFVLLTIAVAAIVYGMRKHREPDGGFVAGYQHAQKLFAALDLPCNLIADELLRQFDEASARGTYTNFDRGMRAYISDNKGWIYNGP